MLCALGCENRIVGRDESSTLPPSVLEKTVVGANSYEPNVEVILELEPDVVFADSMLPYAAEKYEQLQDSGIPVFIADPTDPEPTAHSNETVIDFSCKLISKLAEIVGEEQTAEEYTTFVQYYNDLVKARIETLTLEERPKVMMEWYEPYYTFVTPGLDQAGGINIAENQTIYAPHLSAEFVVEQNPDVIIRAIMSNEHDEVDFIEIRNEILSRTELSEVNAIINEKIYIYDFAIRGGVRCAVGHLYWAKWCQPDLFADIDPDAVNAEINQLFFGTDMPGTFAYP